MAKTSHIHTHSYREKRRRRWGTVMEGSDIRFVVDNQACQHASMRLSINSPPPSPPNTGHNTADVAIAWTCCSLCRILRRRRRRRCRVAAALTLYDRFHQPNTFRHCFSYPPRLSCALQQPAAHDGRRLL